MTISSIQSTDSMRAFVEANPNKVAHRSYLRNQVENKDKNKKFNKGISTAIKSLPIVAAVSTFALTKSAKLAAKSGAGWGVAIAAPVVVSAVNSAAVKSSPKLRKAEKKHSGLTLAGYIAASYAAMDGGIRGLSKLAQSKTVKNVMHSVADRANNAAKNIKANVKVPAAVTNAVASASAFVKKVTPDAVKNLAKTPTAQSLIASGKNIAKKGLANAPAIIGIGALAAMVGKAVSDGAKYSKIKSDVKTAQFETAKDLVNIYGDQNDQLKAENEDLKAQLADANSAEPESDVEPDVEVVAEPDDNEEDA